MGKPIASLSTNGWITEVSAKLDYELNCMANTDGLQSNSFGAIVSFPSIIQEYKNDIDGMSQALRDAMVLKLSRVFQNVTGTAKYALVDPTESRTLAKITININFTEDGKAYSAARTMSFYNGKFKELMEANNG